MNILSYCSKRSLSIWRVSFFIVLSLTFGSSNLFAAPIGIDMTKSFVTITHDPFPGFLPSHKVGGLGAVDVSMASHVDKLGTNTSRGQGITNTIIQPNLFGLSFGKGTGVSQLNPDGNISPSVLQIDYSIDYLFDGRGFNLPWTEFAIFSIESFAGVGDKVTFSSNTNFFSHALGSLGGVNVNFENSGQGFQIADLSDFNPGSSNIPGFDRVTMSGSLLFTADNLNEEAYIHLSQNGGLRPVPIPAAIWFFGSGLAGLFALGKRSKIAV